MPEPKTSPQPASAFVRRLPFVGSIYKDAMTYRQLRADVGDGGRNALLLEHDGLPVPPIKLRDMVRKGGILAEDFLLEGAQVCDALLTFAQAHDVQIQPHTRVFEFGVGCARVARHILKNRPCRFSGSDVDEELIAWCNEYVAPRYRDLAPQFFVNAYEPPIQERDASFDFIYAISVLTHLTEAHQKAWLEELNRLLAPDGRLVVSILERNAAATPMGVVARKRVDKAFTRSWLGKGAAPKHYYNTHNTVRHISGLLADQLQLVGYWPKSIRNIQSLLMFRKLTN